MLYKIEKNIKKTREKRPVSEYGYPLDKMKIGDSFLINEEYNNNTRTKTTNRVSMYLKKLVADKNKPELLEMQFRVGKDPKRDGVPDSGKNLRVWRVK